MARTTAIATTRPRDLISLAPFLSPSALFGACPQFEVAERERAHPEVLSAPDRARRGGETAPLRHDADRVRIASTGATGTLRPIHRPAVLDLEVRLVRLAPGDLASHRVVPVAARGADVAGGALLVLGAVLWVDVHVGRVQVVGRARGAPAARSVGVGQGL